jgi:lactam utilization protein B
MDLDPLGRPDAVNGISGYRPDGSLVPRSEPGAFITDAGEAARQAVRLAR